MVELSISPLQLDALSRDYYGHFDAWAIGALAALANDDCYQPKFYKAPASQDELIAANGYVSYGLRITPGSLIWGFCLPALVSTQAAPAYLVQVTDQALRRKWWDEPVPSFFLANFKPCGLSDNSLATTGQIFSFPNLLNAPYPVVGEGLFLTEFWDTTGGTSGPQGSAQRLELVFGVLEAVGPCQ